MEVKQVIVVRKDLKMPVGKIAAQCAHASMKVFVDRGNFLDTRAFFVSDIPEPMYQWFAGIFTKIVVGIDSEEELLALYEKAKEQGAPCALITDVGNTCFKGVPTNTCIAIGPCEVEEIDALTGHLKLLR